MDSFADSPYSINVNKNKTESLFLRILQFIHVSGNQCWKIFSQLAILCKKIPEIIMLTCRVDKHTINTR